MSFQDKYSDFYNILYKDKDYKAEADYIDKLILSKLNIERKNIKILDLAAGTGRHVFELHNLGYNIAGSDISSSMIDIAKKESKDKDINFYKYSFQESHKIGKKFDVIISMFSAINYLTEFDDVTKSLKNIHNLLDDNGLFIFDYWNGNAVVRDFSPVKTLRKNNEKDEIIRISDTKIDIQEQTATVKFTCMQIKDKQIINEFTEIHKLKYYFFQEILSLLKLMNFEVIHKSTFMNLDKIEDPYDWNISIIAKKINT